MSEPAIDQTVLTDKEIDAQLPKPVGYRVLVALPQQKDTYEGSNILKTDTTKRHDHTMSIMGLVMDMGDQAYADKERFPTGAWCKQGDWVVFRAYSGTRMKMYGQEFRLINDDTVEAVVEDPTGVVRA